MLFTIKDLGHILVVLSKPWVEGSNPSGRTIKRLHIKSLRLFFYALNLGCKKVAKRLQNLSQKKGHLSKQPRGKQSVYALNLARLNPSKSTSIHLMSLCLAL